MAESHESQELGKSGILWRKQGDKGVASLLLIKTKLLQLTYCKAKQICVRGMLSRAS